MENTDDANTNSVWKNAQAPIVIGVTAHRNIRFEHCDRIKRQVGEFIDEIKLLCPNSPIVMLTGLAMGGDMWCAEVAVEKGVKLMLALPDDEKTYVNEIDFPLDGKDKYHALKKAGAADTFVVCDMEKVAHADGDRDYKFRQQAIYVATNCHVLLALWDGANATDKRSECGTNAAVGFALKHNYYEPNGMEFDPINDGAVAWIYSPRENRASGENTDRAVKYLVPKSRLDGGNDGKYYDSYDKMPEQISEILLRTDRFNADCREYSAKQKPRTIQEKEYLLGSREYADGSDKSRKIHDCCKVASALSADCKKKNLRALMSLALTGTALILAFMVYDQLAFVWTSWVCLSAVALLIGVYAAVRVAQKTGRLGKRRSGKISFDAHTRFVEYRALAEALRVQYYIVLFGSDDGAGRYIAWSQKSSMAWVRKAVAAASLGTSRPAWTYEKLREFYKSADMPMETRTIKNNGDDEKSVFVNRLFGKWVGHSKHEPHYHANGQIGYHLKNIQTKREKIKRRDVVKTTVIAATVTTYLALFLCELIPAVDMQYRLFWVVDMRMLFKSILSVFTAAAFLISYYYDKQAIDQTVFDSYNMVGLYGAAIDRANEIYRTFDKKSDCDAALESLVRELAREQLTENSAWTAYNRGDNIELPL